ncbi:MAG: phosphodiester glycosidase family protein, partial [Candidatus Nanopelagicales bacterium]
MRTTATSRHRAAGAAGVLALCTALAFSASPAAAGKAADSAQPLIGGGRVALGLSELPQTRTTRALQSGIELTVFEIGEVDGSERWTVEMSVPAGATDPDPDAPLAVLRDQASANELASRLLAKGFPARAESVSTPTLADFAGGELGWRVRVGAYASPAEADATRALLIAAGFTGSTFYTGWDSEDPTDAGPWVIQALTIDPRTFHGRLEGVFGPDIETRETTSVLAAASHAVAGINAGFFVFDAIHGAPGDPAGMGVYGGRILSESIGDRPNLVVRQDARGTAVTRLTWKGWLASKGTRQRLDGVNRVPGLIRNCGGSGDQPTDLPLHDVTCTDDSELVAFTPDFAASTPSGPGAEVVLSRAGEVIEIRPQRGGPIPAGGKTVQATGDQVADLLAVAPLGTKLAVEMTVRNAKNHKVNFTKKQYLLNGGPELVRNGALHVSVTRDGMVHAGNPSFYYGWVHKRNPRTFAGVDAAGRTV